ncbi:MAG TPA: FeoA family protein [Candidatus Limnocylindrales bacterium]
MSPERPGPSRPTLASLRVGSRLRVSEVDGGHAQELLREGVLPGAIVRVASRTPLGGPVIIVLGRSRLALSADVAASVRGEALG